MTTSVSISIEGLAELRRKCREDVLIAKPFNAAMDEIGQEFASVAASAASVDSGDMQRAFTWKVSTAPVARYVTVKNTAKHRGYAYPGRQEFDVKMGHAHWALNAVNAAWSQVEVHLKKAARAIEDIWSE